MDGDDDLDDLLAEPSPGVSAASPPPRRRSAFAEDDDDLVVGSPGGSTPGPRGAVRRRRRPDGGQGRYSRRVPGDGDRPGPAPLAEHVLLPAPGPDTTLPTEAALSGEAAHPTEAALPTEAAGTATAPAVPLPPVEPAPTGSMEQATGSPLGLGDWFQPLPGGLLPITCDRDGRPAALLVAPPGSPVHSPAAGTVAHTDVDHLELRVPDGRAVHLLGAPHVRWSAQAGHRVAAGERVGRLGDDGRGRLVVTVDGADGRPQDAVALMVGLPDPGELGLGAGDGGAGGLGPDPYELDLALALSPGAPVGSTTS